MEGWIDALTGSVLRCCSSVLGRERSQRKKPARAREGATERKKKKKEEEEEEERKEKREGPKPKKRQRSKTKLFCSIFVPSFLTKEKNRRRRRRRRKKERKRSDLGFDPCQILFSTEFTDLNIAHLAFFLFCEILRSIDRRSRVPIPII
jgi:hypothetical protein